MRKLIVSEFVSLDGVIQAPGGKDEDTEGGFRHGGWTWPYWDDAIGAHFGEVMGEVDTLLLGRKTWQIHGGAFEPMADDDPNEPGFNKLQKYVVSNTLPDATAWRNSSLISGDVVAAVRALKAQPGKNIAMDGSSVLVQTLARHDLIDDYYLLVYPVVLGGGKTIFPDGVRLNLRLVAARPLASGVIVTHYTVDRSE
jgi:dihydrofolate reductase